MKFIPILFSTPMVQAIYAGTKSQTRREIKPQPIIHSEDHWEWTSTRPKAKKASGAMSAFGKSVSPTDPNSLNYACPYGKPGDILWVRETFCAYDLTKGDTKEIIGAGVMYRADGGYKGVKWTPSLFMEKKHCRIFLEVQSVKVQKLQDISNEDSKLEGIHEIEGLGGRYYRDYSRKNATAFSFPKLSFASLWDSINGNWKDDPFVWVIEFKKIKLTDEMLKTFLG
jgi:hypothetical protein